MLKSLKDKLLNTFKKESEAPLKRRDSKFRQMASTPKKGFTWNPVRSYPVNKGCYCGSGLKAKKCCLPYLTSVVSDDFANHIRENWDDLMTGRFTLPRAPKNQ